MTQDNLIRPYQFNFKKVKEADFFDGPEDPRRNDPVYLSKFEVITDEKGTHYKRKTETWDIQLPAFIAQLGEDERPAVESMVLNALALYCKITYVDNFEPVGDHSLATYSAWLASRGGRASSSYEYDKETLEAAAESIGKYLAEQTGSAVVGEKFKTVASVKFSRSSIARNLGAFSTDLVGRILGRVDAWAQYVSEHQPDDADDFAPVYAHFVNILEKHLRQDQVDVAKLI